MLKKVLYTLTSKIGAAGLSFFIMLLSARFLGAQGRGEVALLVANITIITLFTSIVGGSSLVYLAPRRNIWQLMAPSYLWALAVCSLATAAIYVLGQVPPEYVWHLWALSLIMAFFNVNATILVGKEKVQAYNFITFSQVAITLLMLCVFFFIKDWREVDAYVLALYAAYGASFLQTVVHVLRLAERPAWTDFRDTVRTLVRYGSTAQFSNIVTFLNYRLCYYFLNLYFSESAVGIFSIGVQISESIWLVGKSLALVQYSRLVNLDDKAASVRMTLRMAKVSMLVTAAAIVVLMLVPAEVFTLVLGKDFGPVKQVIYTLGPGILAVGTTVIFSHYFAGFARYKINNWASVAGLAVTLPGCLLLVPWLGLVGAGLTSTFSYCTTFLFLLLVFKQDAKIGFRELLPHRRDLQSLKGMVEDMTRKKAA